MKKLYVIMLSIIIITFFIVAPSYSAQKKDGQKKQVIDFEALTIDGKLKKPQVMSIMERKELKFKRLLNLEESFIQNIIKSIDEF
jgi:hypothetical protein